MPFFHFRQANSGGRGHLHISEHVRKNVIVEAPDAGSANLSARINAGIYFDGVYEGVDCPCCGDRWTELRNEENGTVCPAVHGTRALLAPPMYSDAADAVVYFADGRREYAFTEAGFDEHRNFYFMPDELTAYATLALLRGTPDAPEAWVEEATIWESKRIGVRVKWPADES